LQIDNPSYIANSVLFEKENYAALKEFVPSEKVATEFFNEIDFRYERCYPLETQIYYFDS